VQRGATIEALVRANKSGYLSLLKARLLFRLLVETVAKMHTNGISELRICPRNVLISRNNAGTLHAVLCNFEFASDSSGAADFEKPRIWKQEHSNGKELEKDE
jgi:hypothetical protein